VSAENFGATVIGGSVVLTATGIATSQSFGVLSISSVYQVLPVGIGSSEAIGILLVTTGRVTLSPAGVASGEAPGTLVLGVGGVVAAPSGVVSAESVSQVSISVITVLIPVPILSVFGAGVPTVQPGILVISITAITTGEQFGTLFLINAHIVIPASDNTRTTVAARLPQYNGPTGLRGETDAQGFGSGRSEARNV
jgi:hypothetical protein